MKKRKTLEIKEWKKEFTARLEYRMEQLGIDIPTLVKTSTVSRTSIRRYLDADDQTIPSAINVRKLAEALRVNSSWLIDFTIIRAPLP